MTVLKFLIDFYNKMHGIESTSFTMPQYGSYLYLGILALVLVPAVVIGILQLRFKYYGALASVCMAVLLVWMTKLGFMNFLIFILSEMMFILLYSHIARKTKNKFLYYLFLMLSMAQMVVLKISGPFGSNLLGFLGLSYLSFKSIQMIMELYDGSIVKVRFFDLLYFLLFFPTLSSGPIDRYRRFEKDISNPIPRKEYLTNYLPNGIRKILMGIGYKFFLATVIDTYAVAWFSASHSFGSTVGYMYAYSFYLFFDFAGYSNFAVGTSYILGVKTPENFAMPFLSVSIKDFWKRWHISLSSWFGDYIYSRIVMNFLRRKTFKDRHKASHAAQFITMFTMGMWHGLALCYLVYGSYHGILLILNDLYERKASVYKKHKDSFAFQLLSVFVTFHIVCFGFLIFSGFLF